MAVVFSTAVKNSRLQAVISAIDAGPGNGILNLGTTGMAATLSTVILTKPCGTISGGVLTFSGLPIASAGASIAGTIAESNVTDSTGTIVISGLTVGLAGTDFVITQQSVLVGEVISFVSGTIQGN